MGIDSGRFGYYPLVGGKHHALATHRDQHGLKEYEHFTVTVSYFCVRNSLQGLCRHFKLKY